ncbi:MAG: zinc ABC transporter substrate-binding protein [Candidatus Aminicenantales bacterium]|jgi:zinc transport system substrate-binding protein
MKKSARVLVFAIFMVLAGPAFSAGSVRVLTSIFPLREFAAAVVGERGEASLLLPPGAGVHTWQPRPGDILRLAAADLFISVGSGLEPWLSDVVKAVPGGKLHLLEVSRGLPLLPAIADQSEPAGARHEHGPLDPHIWLDFGLDATVIDRIVEALSAIDPAGSGHFRENGESYKVRLRELDSRFREALKDCAGRQMVVAGHAAFGYLAKKYGLVQTALYGLSPDSQPRPKQMMKVVDFCRRENIRTVFFEASVPPDLARTLAAEIHGRILVLNAGHNLTRDQVMKGVGFFDLMEENLKSLREGLGCR